MRRSRTFWWNKNHIFKCVGMVCVCVCEMVCVLFVWLLPSSIIFLYNIVIKICLILCAGCLGHYLHMAHTHTLVFFYSLIWSFYYQASPFMYYTIVNILDIIIKTDKEENKMEKVFHFYYFHYYYYFFNIFFLPFLTHLVCLR